MNAPSLSKVTPDGPTVGARFRGWLATVDLARVLAASLFAAVLVLAGALWSTFGLLPGAVGLLVPFAVWYAALTRQRADKEAYERALAVSAARDTRTMTRPSIPTRAPLDEGGSVGPAPWRPDGA